MENTYYSPLDIARYFLAKSRKAPAKGLTPMQIIKLVYISHGWHWAFLNKPLIDNSDRTEAIQAWTHGPVVEMLYHVFKWHRASVVPWDYLTRTFTEAVPAPVPDKRVEGVRVFLDAVWGAYGHYDGWQLSNLTHKDGSPWDRIMQANKQEGSWRSLHIPDNIIEEYYKGLLDRIKEDG